MNKIKSLNKIFYTLILILKSFQYSYAAFSNNRSWSTRSRGMGGAFVAIADDINSLTHNLAGLANVDSIEAIFMNSILYANLDGISNMGNVYTAFTYPYKLSNNKRQES